MIGSIIMILIGLAIWILVPGWIKARGSARQFVNLACTIIGILITVGGVIDLIRDIL